MAKTILRIAVGGRENIPPAPFQRGFLDPKGWCAEQGIDESAYIERIDVQQDDDGAMTAYILRFVMEEREGRPRLKLNEWETAEKAWEHHPVTSIQLLLDQLALDPVDA